jgi:hypothetical protein
MFLNQVYRRSLSAHKFSQKVEHINNESQTLSLPLIQNLDNNNAREKGVWIMTPFTILLHLSLPAK